MSHIEQRRNLWYATLTVPLKARESVGKAKFIQSLGTPDKREAQRLAPPLIAKWQAIIRQSQGAPNAVAEEAQRWTQALSQVTGHERETLEGVLLEDTEKRAGKEGHAAAKAFYDLATGATTLSASHFEAWKAALKLAPKTIDQMVKDAQMLVTRFTTLEAITKKSIKAWMDDLSARGSSQSSLKRILFGSRNYWKYLQTSEAVPPDLDPFFKVISITKAVKNTGGGSWVPFDAQEVVSLWAKAQVTKGRRKPYQPLADLILLGAYTGARIEELCSLRVKDVSALGAGKPNSFKIPDAKTPAGIREVPIHSALIATVERLKAASTDGYLLSGLTFNKYDDRSNAIGKRFGRLKDAEGFSGVHVFHSIRKTVVTLLENAGVTEGVAADIVGHEKDTMTYGLYSGGNSLSVKRAALELVQYPATSGGSDFP
jgi:integrase